MTLQEHHETFLKHLVYLKGCSPKTIRSYRQGFHSFQASLRENTSPALTDASVGSGHETLTKPRLEAWVIWMRQKGMAPGGANVYIRGFNSFLVWLYKEQPQALAESKPLRVSLLKCQTACIQTFSDSHIKLILAFKPGTFTQLRLWTLIQFLVDTGCRIDEVINISHGDIDVDNLLAAVKGKGSKTRQVPFSIEARKTIWRYMQFKVRRNLNSQWLFCAHSGSRLMYRNCYRDILRFCTDLGIAGVRISPHTFRHTFASNFIRNGGNPFHLQRILGHNSIQTTLKYVHLQSADLSAAHQKFGILSHLR